MTKRWVMSFGAVVLVAAACGGEVAIVLPDGAGGTSVSAAEGSTSDATVTSTASGGEVAASSSSEASATATSSGAGPTGPTPDACSLACKQAASCTSSMSVEACEAGCASVPPLCAPAHQGWLQCLAANGYASTFGCPAVAACEGFLFNYILCRGGCSVGSCGQSPSGSCDCKSACVGSTFETSCFPGDPGLFGCKCKQDGVEVGNCFGPGSAKACDAVRSCCASVFFVDG